MARQSAKLDFDHVELFQGRLFDECWSCKLRIQGRFCEKNMARCGEICQLFELGFSERSLSV